MKPVVALLLVLNILQTVSSISPLLAFPILSGARPSHSKSDSTELITPLSPEPRPSQSLPASQGLTSEAVLTQLRHLHEVVSTQSQMMEQFQASNDQYRSQVAILQKQARKQKRLANKQNNKLLKLETKVKILEEVQSKMAKNNIRGTKHRNVDNKNSKLAPRDFMARFKSTETADSTRSEHVAKLTDLLEQAKNRLSKQGSFMSLDPASKLKLRPNHPNQPKLIRHQKSHPDQPFKLPYFEEQPEKPHIDVEQDKLTESHSRPSYPRRSHHVTRRSDNTGEFETALGQVAQQVTSLSAKVTALQASTTQQKVDLDQQIAKLEARVSTLNTGVIGAAASTYVQWGSSTCKADGAELVYSGVVGGSWYNEPGSAVNYLCLPLNPVLSNHVVPSSHAWLYGAEYETQDSHQDKDPVCAVCRAGLPTTVMVPATNTCESGWDLQYSGYLMTGNGANPAGSEYICVDSSLESGPRSNENKNGKFLQYTVTNCGSLPCEPYVQGKIVTCAVCSK